MFFSADVCQGVPELPRDKVKYLRVFQQDAKTYSTWQKVFQFSGPGGFGRAVGGGETDRVHRAGGSGRLGLLRGPGGRGRCIFSCSTSINARCTRCVRLPVCCRVNGAGAWAATACTAARPPNRTGIASRRPPTPVTPPPWGDESIGYERFVQPVLDRHCGKCHQGEGEARPETRPHTASGHGRLCVIQGALPDTHRPGGLAGACSLGRASPGYGIAGAIPVYGLRPDDVYPNDPATDGPSTIHRTLRTACVTFRRAAPLIDLVDERPATTTSGWSPSNCCG